jgi:hypothetical protein
MTAGMNGMRTNASLNKEWPKLGTRWRSLFPEGERYQSDRGSAIFDPAVKSLGSAQHFGPSGVC